ncbi:MAG: preprotein translocase subunit SecG, partial [Parvularculaceae bacterium]|nr:preprotein translocase subunit SecG [Parvularculaceae bacterium]
GAASDGAGQTAFGAKTGDMLTYATVGIFIVFLGFAIGLNYVVTENVGQPQEEEQLESTDTSENTGGLGLEDIDIPPVTASDADDAPEVKPEGLQIETLDPEIETDPESETDSDPAGE